MLSQQLLFKQKIKWRRYFLKIRRRISRAERHGKGRLIQEQVFSQPEWQAANLIGCYLSLPDEVPTHELIQSALHSGKQIAVPALRSMDAELQFHHLSDLSSLAPGPFGILQPSIPRPVTAEQIDILLVPGLGFDLQCYRLGWGGGYFDRFLKHYSGLSWGLAFEDQICSSLPCLPHDIPLKRTITDTRILTAVA